MIGAGLGKGVLALSMAAALAATPAIAFADQTAAGSAAPAATQAVSNDGDDNEGTNPFEAVATVNGTAYTSLDEAVKAANEAENDAQFVISQDVTEDVTLTFTSKVEISAEKNVTFAGRIVLSKDASGSTVSGVHFVRGAAAEGNFDSVHLSDVSDVTVSDNIFDAPSALFKGNEWQYNGVYVEAWNVASSGVTVKDNIFNLGRMNDTNGKGDVAADSNSNTAVNLAGAGDGGVSNVTISGNKLYVSAPADDATRNASVNLLIANGNNTKEDAETKFGIKNVTVENNIYDGSADAANKSTRFAGISNVDKLTLKGNTVSHAEKGVSQSIWKGNTSANQNVKLDSNEFTNVTSPYDAVNTPDQYGNDSIGAMVQKADGSVSTYNWIEDAVKAINDGDDSFAGATLTLRKSVAVHPRYTFNKKVTVTSLPGFTFNGSLVLNASGSKVTGVNFVVDFKDWETSPLKKGVENSVVLGKNASGAEISGNSFKIESVDFGEVDFQPNAIWLSQGANDVVIKGNNFSLGRSYNNTAAGVNFVGNGDNPIKDAQIIDNKVTFLADNYSEAHAGAKSGSAIFVVANGNAKAPVYGVENITATGNKLDGTNLDKKDIAFAISNVKGATLKKNELTNLATGIQYSNFNGESQPSTALNPSDNTLTNVDTPVDFNAFFAGGEMSMKDITFAANNSVTLSEYKPGVPSITGLVFAGWYNAQGQPAKTGDKNVHAKYVLASDIIKVMGNSLRTDYKNTDGTTDYTKTSLRFSYNIVAPQDGEVTAWSWYNSYENSKGEAVTSETAGTKKRDPTAEEVKDGYGNGFISNVVFTDIDSARYDKFFKTRLDVTFKTGDGTTVSVSDAWRLRTVKGIATDIVAHPKSEADRVYAQGILDALKPGQDTNE